MLVLVEVNTQCNGPTKSVSNVLTRAALPSLRTPLKLCASQLTSTTSTLFIFCQVTARPYHGSAG
jgi:hypothetical protein